jgi:opacity protein-like surface antigen
VGGGGVLGTIPDGWVGLVGLRYHRLLVPGRYPAPASGTAVTLTYTADLVPFASVRIPKGSPPPTQSAGIRSVTEHGLSTRGVGAYPLGLRVAAFPTAALRPFVAGHTGLFYLLDALPDERGRRTNFAVGVGVGLKVALSPRTTLTLGYRYHHLSNGFRGRINPGLDANLLYLGIDTAP